MSEQQPPSGTPEYLEYDTGAPIASAPAVPADASTSRRSRRPWWIAGSVVLLLGVGAGAWAALSFFHQGAQPAEALPSTTVAYVSLDLDPSGGQKLDAFRTLNKFPAFKQQVGVSSVSDLRHKVGDAIVSSSGCPGLDYSRDIDPWLGDRMAAAVVPLGDGEPHVVGVLQVTDEGKARAGLAKINGCSHVHPAGFVIHDGWAIVAQSQEIADEVSAAAGQGTLADDASYQKWTKAVGEAGVVNAYVSPTAGRVLAPRVGAWLEKIFAQDPSSVPGSLPALPQGASNPLSRGMSSLYGAATLRFTGDGLELATAGSGSSSQSGTTGGQLVTRLPSDTAIAAGVSLQPGWFERELHTAAGTFAEGGAQGDLEQQLTRATGLSVPGDIETLLGKGVVVSVGKDIDLQSAESGADGADVPVAATVEGDAGAIQQVLDKLRAKVGDVPFLASDSSGDLVTVGPSGAYRQEVLAGGDLGHDSTFTGVVPDAAKASSVLYVDFDALQSAIDKASAGGDAQELANLTPLRALGISTWTDDGVTRFSLEVTTD